MATKKSAPKIPAKTEAEVMFRSNLQCCVCQEKGDHIHHLGKREDNSFDNLALLCFPHHDKATIKGSLSKQLSKEAIIKFREHHYKVIDNKRAESLKSFKAPIIKLNEETLLTASKNAIVIIEIEKIRGEFFETAWDKAGWEKRGEIFSKLNTFSNHSNHRVAYEIFTFLADIASMTRAKMPYGMALSVMVKAMDFFPSFNDKENKAKSIEIARQCVHLGDNIAYDATIHLKNLAVAQVGLSIIKFMYRTAKQNKITEIIQLINKTYDELESTLKRPERTDLGNAQELVKIFRKDLDEWDLAVPPLPAHLQKIVSTDESR